MQVVDSAGLSLVDFLHRAGFSLQAGSVSRPRFDVLTALKTVFWTYHLCRRTGTRTPYGLERCFEANAGRRDASGARLRSNKWLGYAKGRHEPKSVLPLVEQAIPGANRCLSSPLWPALVDGELSHRQIQHLLRQLSPMTRDQLRRHGLCEGEMKLLPKLIDGKLVAWLTRRPSLDALTTFVLLLRRAHIEARDEIAYRWGQHLWRLLVIASPMLVAGGIARPLAELLDARIMPLAEFSNFRYGFPEGGYWGVIEKFRSAHYCVTSVSRNASKQHQESLSAAILEGRFGWDYHFAFNPIPLALQGCDKGDLKRDSDQLLSAQRAFRLHRWAMNMLSVGRHAGAPPDSVAELGDIWAVDPDPLTLLGTKTRTHWRPVP